MVPCFFSDNPVIKLLQLDNRGQPLAHHQARPIPSLYSDKDTYFVIIRFICRFLHPRLSNLIRDAYTNNRMDIQSRQLTTFDYFDTNLEKKALCLKKRFVLVHNTKQRFSKRMALRLVVRVTPDLRNVILECT